MPDRTVHLGGYIQRRGGPTPGSYIGQERGRRGLFSVPTAMEECWEENKLRAFQNWILYILWTGDRKTRDEIIESLQDAFNPNNYIPVLSELDATCSDVHDFDGDWDNMTRPWWNWSYWYWKMSTSA